MNTTSPIQKSLPEILDEIEQRYKATIFPPGAWTEARELEYDEKMAASQAYVPKLVKALRYTLDKLYAWGELQITFGHVAELLSESADSVQDGTAGADQINQECWCDVGGKRHYCPLHGAPPAPSVARRWAVATRESDATHQRHFAIMQGSEEVARLYFTRSPVDDEMTTRHKAERIARFHNASVAQEEEAEETKDLGLPRAI